MAVDGLADKEDGMAENVGMQNTGGKVSILPDDNSIVIVLLSLFFVLKKNQLFFMNAFRR